MSGKLAGIVALVVGALAATSIEPARERAPVRMRAEDGRSYLVQPQEALGDAVARGAVVQEEEEKGNCVPEPLEDKPPGSVSCKCYEETQCRGSESRQCKRYCRKDHCYCCGI